MSQLDSLTYSLSNDTTYIKLGPPVTMQGPLENGPPRPFWPKTLIRGVSQRENRKSQRAKKFKFRLARRQFTYIPNMRRFGVGAI